METVKLNLGAGSTVIEGFTPIDRKLGGEVYPLDWPDGSVDVIRASHVLEHFSHTETMAVLKHWIGRLKPGGKLMIAVPDFLHVSREYLDGKPINIQGYVMGGHIDGDDHHGAIFDREALAEVMVNCGLERIGPWESEIQDCASLPVSLNLQGFKPTAGDIDTAKIKAVLSAPRYGPVGHMRCAFNALQALRISHYITQGAYWAQTLTEGIEKQLADPKCEYVLTMDYDTIFTAQDIAELYRLIRAYPEADAVIPVQAMRGEDRALFNAVIGKDGKPRTRVYAAEFDRNLTRVATGHFGLTLFRASALRDFERPWMLPVPNDRGRFDGNHQDQDINFWIHWGKAGKTAFLANRVVVGHLQETILWPGKDFKPIHQHPKEYVEAGIPAGVAR